MQAQAGENNDRCSLRPGNIDGSSLGLVSSFVAGQLGLHLLLPALHLLLTSFFVSAMAWGMAIAAVISPISASIKRDATIKTFIHSSF